MNPGHPLKLRRQIIKRVENGHTLKSTAIHYNVSESSVIRLLRKWRTTGSIENAERVNSQVRVLEPHSDLLNKLITEDPRMTLRQIKAHLEERGIKVCVATVHNMLRHLGHGPRRKKPKRSKKVAAQAKKQSKSK